MDKCSVARRSNVAYTASIPYITICSARHCSNGDFSVLVCGLIRKGSFCYQAHFLLVVSSVILVVEGENVCFNGDGGRT